MSNPSCTGCGSASTIKDGYTRSDNQAYRCKDCGKRFSGNPAGRPPIGKKRMSPAEQSRRWRAKRKQAD